MVIALMCFYVMCVYMHIFGYLRCNQFFCRTL